MVKINEAIEVTQAQYNHIKSNLSGHIFVQAQNGVFKVKPATNYAKNFISKYLGL